MDTLRELRSCMKFAHLQRLLDFPLPSLLSLICALHITSFSVVCRMSQTDKYTKRTAPHEITQNEQKNATAALRAEVRSTVSVWSACTTTSEISNPVGSHPNVQNPRRRRPRAHKGTPDQAQVELIQSLQII